jgi:hypothetical protein
LFVALYVRALLLVALAVARRFVEEQPAVSLPLGLRHVCRLHVCHIRGTWRTLHLFAGWLGRWLGLDLQAGLGCRALALALASPCRLWPLARGPGALGADVVLDESGHEL